MIAVVLKGWPRLSETFIARELEALEARGLALRLWSLRAPTDRKTHAVHGRVRAPVTYLPEYLHQAPLRVLRAWWRMRRTPGYRAAKALWAADWRRDRSRNRLRRFGQALVLAAELTPGTTGLYAHFMHTPADVARYAAALTGLPFGISAHAKDIWTTRDWDLAQKLREAAFVTTCTADGQSRLGDLGPVPALNRHGLDLAQWPAAPDRPMRDGSDPADPVRLLSVSRAVEKKGIEILLAALAQLSSSLHWRFTHIGGGPLGPMLRDKAAAWGLAERIDWRGSQSEDAVLAAMRAADIFVLTPRIAADGDRDGLPNVLVEAQSQGLPVVVTDVGGVGELTIDGANGLVSPPDDPAPVAASLAALIADPVTRVRLGAAGRARVEHDFSAAPSADAIAGLLRRLA